MTGCTSIRTDSSKDRDPISSDEDNNQSSKKLSITYVTQSEVCTDSQPDENTELSNEAVECTYGKTHLQQNVENNQSIGTSAVIEALLTTQYPEFVVNEAEHWKKKFNTDPVVWDDFNKTSFNPLVLVKLIDDWLMHLKSPVLRMQDLHSLQQNPLFQEDILTSLEIFEKPVVCLMSLFAKLITHLHPLSEQLEYLLIERVLNWLCQKQSKPFNIITNTNKFNEQFQCYHHTRFDDLMQMAFRIMHFLIRFVKSDCTLIESVDTLSKFLSISQ